MSTYKNLIGKDVNFLTTDPDNAQAEGQIWYNSPAGAFKDLLVSEAWSSSGNMINQRAYQGSAGSVSAGLVFGGSGAPSYPSPLTLTEEYNGSGFSVGGAMNVALAGLNGSGTQTAALAFGGFKPPSNTTADNTEEYDGSSWTAGGALGTARFFLGSAKSAPQTAGLAFGGNPGYKTNTEEYNGSSWTAGGALNQGRNQFDGAGTQTAGLAVGGQHSPPFRQLTDVEEYDGSSWTSVTGIPTATEDNAASGLQTAALTYGGSSPSATANSFAYNGSTWTATPSMANARQNGAGTGTGSSSALSTGGGPPSNGRTIAEEFTSSINVITAAAWASGGTLPSPGRQGYGVGTGTQTASIIAGGPPDSTQNQFYDGSSWTNLASIPSGVTNSQGFGDSEELLMAGGNTGAPYSALTYVYSRPGNSWTAVSSPGNINTARALGAGCGALSTAGIIAGGDVPSYTTATENWNGSSWTTVNALPTATGNGVGSCGTQTAGLIWSGENPGDPTAEETYEWDGTNWTSSGNRIIGVRAVRGGAGTQTAALTFGGWLDPGGSVSTEGYDGTSWSTRPNMAGAAANNFQTGTQTAALRAGGTDGPGYTAVEEFTGETTALNIKTITTS